jgi:hypothetical protein
MILIIHHLLINYLYFQDGLEQENPNIVTSDKFENVIIPVGSARSPHSLFKSKVPLTYPTRFSVYY